MLNFNNLRTILKGNKEKSEAKGRINIKEDISGIKNIQDNILGSLSIINTYIGKFNIYSNIQGEINNFISKDKIINLSGVKQITNELKGIRTENINLIGATKNLFHLNGLKSFMEDRKGNFNIFHKFVSYISGFKTNHVIYVRININNKINYCFNKISKFNLYNILSLINNIYLQSVKTLFLMLNATVSPEVRHMVNNVNIKIHNIIDLSYNEDLIQFESFYKTFKIQATIDNNINILNFNKLINLFIEVFYDINGNINISLLKEISIKNNLDFNYLLKLLSEVSLDINNLIDLTMNNGASFSLGKKLNIELEPHVYLNLNFIATKFYILNDYKNTTLNAMFDKSIVDLIKIDY